MNLNTSPFPRISRIEGTRVTFLWMSATTVYVGGVPLPVISNMPGSPFATGTQPRCEGHQLVDRNGVGLTLANIATFTLTIVDTLTGQLINNADHIDILNTNRGLVSDGGDFIITLQAADTAMDEVPGARRVERSLVIEWSTQDTPPEIGRHQYDFVLLRLASD